MVIFFLLPFVVLAEEQDKIAKISIMGNERIDTGFIMNNIKTKENETYNIDKVRDDMKNIYKTGFFSDVQIDVAIQKKEKTLLL